MIARRQEAAGTTRERILVVCTQYIGDTLLAIPFLRNLRQAHPGAVIDVCAEGGPRAVLAHCPYVDDRISWSRPPKGRRGGLSGAYAGLKSQADWLRSRGYTTAYLLKPSLSAATLAMLAGIPCRIGFAGESSPLLTRRIRRRRGRHQAETYLDLLRAAVGKERCSALSLDALSKDKFSVPRLVGMKLNAKSEDESKDKLWCCITCCKYFPENKCYFENSKVYCMSCIPEDEDDDECCDCGRTEKDCEDAGLEFDTGCLSTYKGRILCPDCIPCSDCEELGKPCDNCCEDEDDDV